MEFKDFVPLIIAALGASLFGFLGAYFGALGRIQADKQEREFLRQQLADNTQIVKSIEGRLSREEFLGRHELEYRQRQLAEFYGPVYGYLKSQRNIWEMWHKERMLDQINFDIKKLFSQQNAIVRNLIITRMHLIDKAELPEYFVTFCTSTLLFDLLAAQSDAGFVPENVANDPRSKLPDAFIDHIIETTERLKGEVFALHERFRMRVT